MPPPSRRCFNYLEETVEKTRQTRGNNRQEKQVELSPVQATDHVPHSIDETLVLLRVTDDEAVELLHIGINGVQSRRLSAPCMATAQDAGSKRSFNVTHAVSGQSLGWEQPGVPGRPQETPKVTVRVSVDGSRSRGGLDSNRSFFVCLSWQTGMMCCCCTTESHLFTATVPRDSEYNDCKIAPLTPKVCFKRGG